MKTMNGTRWLAVALVAVFAVLAEGCATDPANTAEPETPVEMMQRITIWSDSDPIASFRERLADLREQMAEVIERGEVPPSDVLERLEKMEAMEARYDAMEAAGYVPHVDETGMGTWVLPAPDSVLGDTLAAAGARCGNINLDQVWMNTGVSFVAGASGPGSGWWNGDTWQGIRMDPAWNAAFMTHSGHYNWNNGRAASKHDNTARCRTSADTFASSTLRQLTAFETATGEAILSDY